MASGIASYIFPFVAIEPRRLYVSLLRPSGPSYGSSLDELMTKTRKSIISNPRHGRIDRSAPFWGGDTAETIIERRKAEAPTGRRSRSGRPPRAAPANDDERTLRRLERAIERRKTIEARVRLQARIDELQLKLAL